MPPMQSKGFTPAQTPSAHPALAGFSQPGYADFLSDAPSNAPAPRQTAPAAERSVALW